VTPTDEQLTVVGHHKQVGGHVQPGRERADKPLLGPGKDEVSYTSVEAKEYLIDN